MTASIVFDLDGTLVDSIGDLAAAANRMLEDAGHNPLPVAAIRGFVGNGLPKLVERVILHCDLPMEQHERLTQLTLAHYEANSINTTVPYPGMPQALASLRDMGCTLGVCTNKPEAPARHVLEALGLSQYFSAVLGGDTLPVRKPDPAHLIASFEVLGDQHPRLYVGDSEVDAKTAARAQIPFLLFTEGYRKSPVAEIAHTATFADAAALPEMVANLATADRDAFI